MSNQQYYDVFIRNWWRKVPDPMRVSVINRNAYKLIPNPGARRSYIARHVTYDHARQLCDEYNSTHKPGVLSRKAEFISI